ncbi:MAG: hypothetical protein JXQ67_00740 [Campylobacterales bacterium]|nr:hypothetical protein [Campylobacterales bacterium]
MKTQFIPTLLLSTLPLLAVDIQTVHSSASLYYELRDFSNSVQKDDGAFVGVGGDIHYKEHELRFTYEKGNVNTKQPPLQENLNNDILFLRYGYNINEKLAFNTNFINVMYDNMVPTDEAVAYGLGVTYSPSKALSANFTQYYTNYQIFESYQSDLALHYKSSYEKLKYKISLIAKHIDLRDKDSNIFSKNAQNNYTTAGFKFHSHYESYHFGFGAYFGKRVFAIMNDGFKIQHHAMEIDKTYALGIGKTFGDLVIRYQYIYQRAVELPMQNKNVDIVNNRFIVNYKF